MADQAVLVPAGGIREASWAVIMLQRPQAEDVVKDELGREVFPASVADGVRDPSNTLKMMRQAFE